MNIRADHPGDEQARLLRVAERMIEERGDAISVGALAIFAGVPRARLEAISGTVLVGLGLRVAVTSH